MRQKYSPKHLVFSDITLTATFAEITENIHLRCAIWIHFAIQSSQVFFDYLFTAVKSRETSREFQVLSLA